MTATWCWAARGSRQAATSDDNHVTQHSLRKGSRFRALRPVRVFVLVHLWDVPGSDGCDAVLPGGEEVLLDYDPNPARTTGCWVVPVRARELEPILVEERIRKSNLYPGIYGVGVDYEQLWRDFVFVREGGDA